MRCPRPIGLIDKKTKQARLVPCGQCFVCRLNYAMDWCFRCDVESRAYADSDMCFVTLTYDDLHLPFSLNKEDVCNFHKRLRSAGFRHRFIECGEYGSQTHRPHYHLIFFGFGVDADCWIDKVYDCRSKGYHCNNKYWPFGFCYLGNVTRQSIAYCCKYTLKSVKGKGAVEAYDSKGLERPFFISSRNPGIGRNVDKDWLLSNNHFHLPLNDFDHGVGDKLLPRYYFELLYPPGSPEREVFDHNYTMYLADKYRKSFEDELADLEGDDVKAARAASLLLDFERRVEIRNDRSSV